MCAPADDNLRLILCDFCGSEGRDLRSNGGPDDIDYGECPVCEGTGAMLVEVQPIDMHDLEVA